MAVGAFFLCVTESLNGYIVVYYSSFPQGGCFFYLFFWMMVSFESFSTCFSLSVCLDSWLLKLFLAVRSCSCHLVFERDSHHFSCFC